MARTLTILFLLITGCSFSQRFSHIEMYADTTELGQSNELRLTVVLTKRNGKEFRIVPGDPGSKWNKVRISGNDLLISADQGMITFNQKNVHAGNRLLELKISAENNTLVSEQTIPLPYVTQLFVADSELVVNEPHVLNYLVLFSNGKMSGPIPQLFPLTNVTSRDSVSLDITGEFCYRITRPTQERSRIWILTDSRSGMVLAEKRMTVRYGTSLFFQRNGSAGMSGYDGERVYKTSADGFSGTSGNTGHNAPDLAIYIRQDVCGSDTIITFHTLGTGIDETRMVKFCANPSYVITANGGKGGPGGDGSEGESGNIDTEKNIDSPHGGDGGSGGQGGAGGDGGVVMLYFSPETAYLRPLLTIHTNAGEGGAGGRGAKGGRGDYTNSKLLGILLDTKDGKDGRPGAAGPAGREGHVLETYLPSREAWEAQYKAAQRQ
jgi:hypothetical protein